MRWKSHVRFGGRIGETHRSKERQGAPVRPYTKLLGPKKWTYFYLYVLLDIYSRYVVGWMVAERENSALAGRLIEFQLQAAQGSFVELHGCLCGQRAAIELSDPGARGDTPGGR